MQELSSLLPALLASLALLPTTLASPLVQNDKFKERQVQSYFHFASIGDSWAAGPGIIARDAYGGPDNWDGCYLHKAAWEPLMAGDDTWTDDPIFFNFAACSGAKLEDATKPDNPQMGKVDSPQLLTMQLGGNNAHFTDIAVACLYVGDKLSSQKDYPDPDGTCYQTITQWETYLDTSADAGAGQSFYFDHHQALQAIMESDLVKGRDDFYLYIVSYAEFFNTSPDSDWCNDQSFGLFKKPKLSNALRSKLNELVRKINAVITQSTSDMNNDHIGSLDPSPVFENHRFCEPHHTLNNQYFLNDVWFWNISPPEDDPNYLTIQNADAVQSAWAQDHIFINGTAATEDQLLAMLGNSGGSDPYSLGRTFHPKDGGHVAIKDAMIAFLRNNNVPGVKQAAPPPPPPKTQPYAPGPVHIHIKEYWSCLDDSDNLSVEITMWDSTSQQIGYIQRTQAGASASASMGSKLENPLIVTPEWAKGGYIQFQLGDLQFNTNDDTDDTKPVHCKVGGYDPRQGPTCYIVAPPGPPIYYPDAVAINQMDCDFPAPDWHGGNPSDGTSL